MNLPSSSYAQLFQPKMNIWLMLNKSDTLLYGFGIGIKRQPVSGFKTKRCEYSHLMLCAWKIRKNWYEVYVERRKICLSLRSLQYKDPSSLPKFWTNWETQETYWDKNSPFMWDTVWTPLLWVWQSWLPSSNHSVGRPTCQVPVRAGSLQLFPAAIFQES